MASATSLIRGQLKSLDQDSSKLTIYHQTSNAGLDRQVILEGVSTDMVRAFSPYCKAVLDSNVNRKAITITGGSASACKETIKYMNKYCDEKRAVPTTVGPSKLLAYLQLHESAQVLQIDTVARWATVEAELLLEEPVSEDDITAALSMYTTSRCAGLLTYNLAYCMSAWLGGYSENCQFVQNFEKNHAEFVVQLRLTCAAFNAERADAWTKKFKALCAVDERIRAEEERKLKNQQKRKNRQQRKQERSNTSGPQVVAPVRKVTPSPAGSYAAVAAGPVQAPQARAITASAPAHQTVAPVREATPSPIGSYAAVAVHPNQSSFVPSKPTQKPVQLPTPTAVHRPSMTQTVAPSSTSYAAVARKSKS